MPKPLPKKTEPIPTYGKLYTLADFDERCENGDFNDDDGYGQYCIPPLMYSKTVSPSDSPLDKRFTHVVWFNK